MLWTAFGGQFRQRNVLARVKKLGERLVAQLTGIHDVLDGALKVEVRPVRLDHLHDQVIVLAVDVEEQLLLLERLRVVIRSCWSATAPLIVVGL